MLKRAIYLILIWGVPLAMIPVLYTLNAGMVIICLYSFLMLLACSRVMTIFWLKPLECSREINKDVVNISESVRVVVKIRNQYFWPILWMYVEETLPKKMPVSGVTKRFFFLPPRKSFYLYYTFTPTKRGCHQLGPIVTESGDIFGLFRKTRMHKRRNFVTAVPPYTLIEEFQVGQRRWLGENTARNSLFEDPPRIRGIRDYRRGAALKRIHWKSPARPGQLVSKVYDPVIVAGATVVLDFHRDRWMEKTAERYEKQASEIGVETACSICRYLWDGGWKVGLFSNGRDPLGLPGVTIARARAVDSLTEGLEAARSGWVDKRLEPVSIRASTAREQFAIIHENLGRIRLSDGLPVEDLVMNELPYIEKQQVLVFITGSVDDSLISALQRIRAQGYRIMMFIVFNSAAHDRAFEALTPHNIDVYDLEHERRITEVATGRRFY